MNSSPVSKKSRYLICLVGLSLTMSSTASAQFGGLFKKKSSRTIEAADGCDIGKKSIGKSILGRVIGDVTGRASRELGYAQRYVPTREVAGTLTDSIACRLDPAEQKQAAAATIEATRGEKVGTSVAWESNTRDKVSGTSTVTQRTASANGSSCMNLTDIVIVDGEETKVSKKMCKGPGQSQYVLTA